MRSARDRPIEGSGFTVRARHGERTCARPIGTGCAARSCNCVAPRSNCGHGARAPVSGAIGCTGPHDAGRGRDMRHRSNGNMPMPWGTWMRSGRSALGQTAHKSGDDESSFHTAFLSSVDRVVRSFACVRKGIARGRFADIDGTKPCVSVCRPPVTACNNLGLCLPEVSCQQILRS